MTDQVTVTMSREDAKRLRARVLAQYAFHDVASTTRLLAALDSALDRATTGDAPGDALDGEPTIVLPLRLTFADYESFSHALSEGVDALNRDAEMWDGYRPERASGDRESAEFASRLLETLHAAANAQIPDALAKREAEGKALFEQHMAELAAMMAELAAMTAARADAERGE